MAKLCNLVKNARRMKLATQHRELRTELRAVIKSPNASDEEKDKAYAKLRKLPRDANPNRYKNRCQLTGRPRSYHRKFNISRNMLRKLALEGEIPGMKKSSW